MDNPDARQQRSRLARCLRRPRPRAIALELKTATGRVTAEQTDWLEKLRLVGVEAHLIRLPQDWDRFSAITAPDPRQLTLQKEIRP